MKIALAQMCSSIDPAENAPVVAAHIAKAAAQDCDIIFTPEMTGMMDCKRARAASHVSREADDPVLAAAREAASANNIWVQLGSLALLSDDDPAGKWVNRSLLIDSDGDIRARYDKIHLFDVDLSPGSSMRESSAYRAGEKAVVVPALESCIGLSICYDVRFASLYTALTNAGAEILSIPAAFTVPTGKAHGETLLRARAIESAAFVVAATQSGEHGDGRSTWGHSMVVDPWGRVLLDMGQEPGLGICEIDLGAIEEVRGKIPAVANRRTFALAEPRQ